MTAKVTVSALKCERCGHVWLPRTADGKKNVRVKACAKCKSGVWDIKPVVKNVKKNKNKSKRQIAASIALVAFMAITMTIAPSLGNHMVFAAKGASSSGGGGSSGSSSGGSGDGGGSSKGSSSDSGGGGSSKGSDKASHSGGGDKNSNIGSNGDNLNDDDHGPPSAPGNDLPGNDRTKNSNPIVKPLDPCHPFNRCTPKIDHFPRFHDHDRHDHGDVRVVQKTVVVHDHNNNPQTLIIQANTAGQCVITQQQISDHSDLLQSLVDTCASITILNQ